MTLAEQIRQLQTALKNSQAAVRVERKGRVAAEKGKATAEKGKATAEKGKATAEKARDAAQEKVEKLSDKVKEVTEDLRSVAKGRKAAEKERDAALKTVEKSTKTAEAAEARNYDNETEITYLQRQVQAAIALSSGYGLRGTDHDQMWDRVKELDRAIADRERLKSITGCTPGQFEFHLKHFETYIKSAPNMPLFRGDARHAGKPGNRCKLYPRHVLLLTLLRLYTGAGEDAMQSPFGIDQSNVSRYLALGYRILGEMTVTADFMTDVLKTYETLEDIRKIIPYIRILVDGTHIERVRPGGSAARKAAYSGKKKRFTFNVQVMTNYAGLLLNLSEVVDGSTHDYKLFKEHLAKEGAWLSELAKLCKAYGEELELVEDLGYQGMETDYGDEFKVTQGIKRKRKDSPGYEPKHGGLTEKQVKHNKEVAKIRIYVEHGMAKIKRFKLTRGPFVGTAEDLRCTLNVVTGLANTNHLWDHAKDAPGKLLTKLTGKIEAGLAAKTVWT